MLQLQIILQTIDIINSYWFSFGLITTSISFYLPITLTALIFCKNKNKEL